MGYRRKMNGKKSRRMFSRSAKHVNRKNGSIMAMRGGRRI